MEVTLPKTSELLEELKMIFRKLIKYFSYAFIFMSWMDNLERVPSPAPTIISPFGSKPRQVTP